MPKAILIDPQRKEAWDAFVYRHPDAIAWHVYDWCKVLESYYALEYLPIAVINGSEVRGVLPLYRLHTLRSGTALISIPYVVAGGIVSDDAEAERLLLEEAVRRARALGGVPLTLKQYRHRVAGDLVCDASFYNLELSLCDGVDELWSNLSQENRESVESTQSEPVHLEYPSSDLDAFHRALALHQRAGGVPAPSRRWLELLLGQMYSIALLRRGARIVAGTLVKSFRRTASFPYTCSAGPDFSDHRWVRRLYWELLVRLSAEGYQIAHSGRIPASNAVPRYRLGWGGRRHEYYYQYHGLRGRTESGSKRGRSRAAIEAVWRRLPLAATRLLGPPLIKQYP